VEKICAAFGEDAVWVFKPTREGNAIVLAQRTASRPSSDALLQAAHAVEKNWGLPALKWLKVFKPLVKSMPLGQTLTMQGVDQGKP
jgi:hypothetical protein